MPSPINEARSSSPSQNMHAYYCPTFEEVPEFLHAGDYDTVRDAMLFEDETLPSALLTASKYQGHTYEQLPMYAHLDTSLARQLKELTVEGADTASAPEAILFTELSAIPIADAVRGFYDAIDEPCPLLATIKADHKRSERFYSPSRATIFRTSEEKQEINRLSRILSGIKRLAIVDQFVASGKTQRYAAELLFAATNITEVTLVQGLWYEEAGDKEHISVDAVTSRHRNMMYEIGLSVL